MTQWRARASDPPLSRRPAVWILEDSPAQGAEIRDALSRDFDVQLFGDAPAFLEAVSVQQPAVVVLDWRLPEISGLEVLQIVRLTHDEVTLPVLILTAVGNSESDMLQALAAGANDFVSKPFEESKLTARVSTLVRVCLLHGRARQAEQQLQQTLESERMARKELEQSVQFEQQLIGIVSHDLRTPVSAISLGAGLLATDPSLTERQAQIAGRVVSSASRASRMIRDLLDFTAVRIGQGLPIKRVPVELHQLVRTVVADVQLVHPRRSIVLRQTGDAQGSWDPDRIGQVIMNLSTNAIDYSPAGSVVLIETSSHGQWVSLSVQNQGRPIPQNLIPALFSPMHRGPHEGEPNRRSVELGLFIVQGIVQSHHGIIEVTSTLEEGTRFTIRLPRSGPGDSDAT